MSMHYQSSFDGLDVFPRNLGVCIILDVVENGREVQDPVVLGPVALETTPRIPACWVNGDNAP